MTATAGTTENDTQMAVDPGQTSMFGANPVEETAPTIMNIPHDDSTYSLAAESSPSTDAEEKDEIPNSTKIKVLSALAIVAVAGYIAYWVQEPVQLRADVLTGTEAETTTPESTTATDDSVMMTTTSTDDTAVTSTTTVADATVESKNVDVSLFGFEPAVLKIDKGVNVIWTNTSTEDQTLIGSGDNGQSFTSPVLTAGSTFNFKFDQDGTYQYYSTYNPALKATITVGTGTAVAAEETTATDTSTTVDPTSTTVDTTATTTDTTGGLFGSAEETVDTTAIPVLTSADPSTATQTTTTTSTTSTTSTEELKGAAPGNLAKTGPAENLYAVVLLGIVFFNRKRLAKIFR